MFEREKIISSVSQMFEFSRQKELKFHIFATKMPSKCSSLRSQFCKARDFLINFQTLCYEG